MLVDTSVWIDYFNGHLSPQADRLEHAIADSGPFYVPGLVLAEVLLGLGSESQAEKIASLLDAFIYVKGPSRPDYLDTARIYRLCRSQGYTIRSLADCAIAQLCLRDGLPLLCKDRDFLYISQCFPLLLV